MLIADRFEGEKKRGDGFMLIIDRFEGDWAVIEDGARSFNIPRRLVPAGASEGDVILIRVAVDREATGARKDRIRGLAEDLFRD